MLTNQLSINKDGVEIITVHIIIYLKLYKDNHEDRRTHLCTWVYERALSQSSVPDIVIQITMTTDAHIYVHGCMRGPSLDHQYQISLYRQPWRQTHASMYMGVWESPFSSISTRYRYTDNHDDRRTHLCKWVYVRALSRSSVPDIVIQITLTTDAHIYLHGCMREPSLNHQYQISLYR